MSNQYTDIYSLINIQTYKTYNTFIYSLPTGKASIAQTGQALDHITLELPNIHNIPFDLTRYGFKADPKGESPTIFFPIDEPHGMIKATIHRDGASNNRKHRSKM